jgi:hypothetical protein
MEELDHDWDEGDCSSDDGNSSASSELPDVDMEEWRRQVAEDIKLSWQITKENQLLSTVRSLDVIEEEDEDW